MYISARSGRIGRITWRVSETWKKGVQGSALPYISRASPECTFFASYLQRVQGLALRSCHTFANLDILCFMINLKGGPFMSRRSSGNCGSSDSCCGSGCGCGCGGCGCGGCGSGGCGCDGGFGFGNFGCGSNCCFGCGDYSCVLSSIYNVYTLQYLASILYTFLGCGFGCGCGMPNPCNNGCNTGSCPTTTTGTCAVS